MKFTLPNVRQTVTNIVVRNEKFSLVDRIVFLGIMSDAKLQWGSYISKLS